MSSLISGNKAHPQRPSKLAYPESLTASGPKRGFSLKLIKQSNWVSRMSLFGSIGWAIVVPALLGASMGFWMDTLYPGRIVWASILLPLGIFLGCLNAGYWFQQDFDSKK